MTERWDPVDDWDWEDIVKRARELEIESAWNDKIPPKSRDLARIIRVLDRKIGELEQDIMELMRNGRDLR